MFKIYQANEPTFRVEKDKKEYDKNLYKMVWEYSSNASEKPACVEKPDGMMLEVIFDIFNNNRPENFKGHSLSVGDIVELEDRLYICDRIGWKKLAGNSTRKPLYIVAFLV